MPAKSPASDEEERASKLDNAEGEHLSKNIYEDGRESSPTMMSSPRARKNGVNVSSRENVGATIWKLSSCSGQWKTGSKDGSRVPPSTYEIGCQKDYSRSNLSAKVAANSHQPTQVGLGHHGGRSFSQDRSTVDPVLAASEYCTQDRPSMGLASAVGDASAAHQKRKSKSNSCKKGFIKKGKKGIFFTRPSKPSSSARKSCKIKAVEGSTPELVHNQGPSIDSGFIGDLGIENMNQIFLTRQHPFSIEEIWEGGKMLGATLVSDEAEIVARITAMEEQDYLIWQQQNASTTAKPLGVFPRKLVSLLGKPALTVSPPKLIYGRGKLSALFPSPFARGAKQKLKTHPIFWRDVPELIRYGTCSSSGGELIHVMADHGRRSSCKLPISVIGIGRSSGKSLAFRLFGICVALARKDNEDDATHSSVLHEIKTLVVVREFDPEKDVEDVEDVERRCEVGPSGKLSIFTDLLGDPICRIRHSPAFRMLVAEMVEGHEEEQASIKRSKIVGMIRGCIKTVTCGKKFPRSGRNGPDHPSNPLPVFTKLAYVLGLRVSPSHRRMGIGLKLVTRLEEWFRENGAEYSYMATENDNLASIKLFTAKCGYSKFRTPSILVQPVFAHRVRVSSRVSILKLKPSDAESLYRCRFSTTEFFPRDIESVLNNRLSLGTFLAVPRGTYDSDWSWPGADGFLSNQPESWAVVSVWNCKDLWRLEVRGASQLRKGLAKTTRIVDRAFPWLQIPSVPELFRPFGLHFLYGLGGEGPRAVKMIRALCGFAHNLAKEHGCGVVATEVSMREPLRFGIPHWKSLSCAVDLWCMKRLGDDYSDGSVGDWTKSPPGLSIFVDPREL
ncbi:hypothetical protein Ancab_025913 [Ancistrocladus abbreviatus]